MAVIQQRANFPPDAVGASAIGAPPSAPPVIRRNPYARQNVNPPARAQMPNTGNVPFTGFVPSQQRDPRYDPNMVSTEDTPNADPLSPTTIVLKYLKERGYPLTAENIRRAVEGNARDPGAFGGNVVNYTRGDTGGNVELRNAGPEGTSAAPSGSRRGLPVPPQPPGGATPPMDKRDSSSTGDGSPPLPDAGSPDVGTPMAPLFMPPPAEGAQVSSPVTPQMPPPPAGAAVATPTPPDPIRDAITRAISGPPEVPALPAPPVRPQIAAPPEVPALPAPAPQLALPAPETPRVPALPAPEPGLGDFSGEVQGPPGGRVRVGNVTPKIAPGPRVQGAPIQPGPVAGPLGRAAVGGVTGFKRGGVGGAAAGAAPGVSELIDNILSGRNLHLY
jgi:hypothetical protein